MSERPREAGRLARITSDESIRVGREAHLGSLSPGVACRDSSHVALGREIEVDWEVARGHDRRAPLQCATHSTGDPGGIARVRNGMREPVIGSLRIGGPPYDGALARPHVGERPEQLGHERPIPTAAGALGEVGVAQGGERG